MWRARRPPDRRVRRPRARASSSASSPARSRCSSSPTCSACRRPTTSRSARRSRAGAARAPRGSAAPATTMLSHNPLEFLYERFTPYIEERGASPATTCSPASPPRPSPTARPPTSSTWCGSRPTCSPPARRRPCACWRRDPAARRGPRDPAAASASERDRIPNFVEEVLRMESPVKGDFRLLAGPDHGRRRRDARRHHRDGAERRRPTATPAASTSPTSSRSTGPTPASTSPSATASTSARARPLARSEGRVSLERLLDRMADIRISEARARPARRPPLPATRPTYILRGLNRLHLEYTSLD